MNLKRLLLQSTFSTSNSCDSYLRILRQQREHHVFAVLLQMVPNLEACLMEGDNEDVVALADMVWHDHLLCPSLNVFKDPAGCVKSQVLGLTTPKASKVLFLIG